MKTKHIYVRMTYVQIDLNLLSHKHEKLAIFGLFRKFDGIGTMIRTFFRSKATPLFTLVSWGESSTHHTFNFSFKNKNKINRGVFF